MSGRVPVRLLREDDVPALSALPVAARTGFQRFGYAPRYLRIAGEWQDHVLFQLLDEPGMR